MSDASDMDHLIARAKQQGFRHTRTNKGHHQLYAPNGHDIIVAAGTTVNREGFEKFKAQLRRAGYVDETSNGASNKAVTVLGEKLKEVLATAPKEELAAAELQKMKTSEAILLALKDGQMKTLLAIIEGAQFYRAGTSADSIRSTTSIMAHRGKIVRFGVGQYRLAHAGDSKPPAPLEAKPSPAAPEGNKLGNEEDLERDIQKLDAALVALGVIEEVVRRHRTVMRALADLKSKLSGIM